MSTMDATLNDLDPAFAAWASQIRDLHAKHARPVSEEWPPCPLPSPEWSTEREVVGSEAGWPVVEIWDYSEWHESGSVRLRRERYAEVAVDQIPEGWNENGDYKPELGEVHGVSEIVAIEFTQRDRIQAFDLEPSAVGDLAAALAALN